MKQYPRKRVQYVTQLAAQHVDPEQLGDELVLHYSIPSLQESGIPTKEPASDIASNKWLLVGGEVLISKLNVHKNCIAIADKTDKLPIVASTEFVPLRTVNVNPRFLAYAFQSVETIELLTSFSESATRSHARVNPSDIVKLKIPQPPLETQRRIADYLDRETARIDALVAEKEKMLALLEEKRTALISRAVTRGLNPNAPLKPSGLDWLGDIPAHWDVLEIKRGFELIGSGTTPPTNEEEWYQGDVLWVTTSELRETVVNDTQKKLSSDALESFPALRIYPKGSLMVAMYGATIGRVGLLGMEATVNQAVCVLASGLKLKEEYVFFLLQLARPYLVSYATGGGQPNLNAEKIRDFKVPCPPMVEQSDIVSYLNDVMKRVDVTVAAISESISLLKERRAALITAAVSGQFDLGVAV